LISEEIGEIMGLKVRCLMKQTNEQIHKQVEAQLRYQFRKVAGRDYKSATSDLERAEVVKVFQERMGALKAGMPTTTVVPPQVAELAG
jgi:hypothetical protein